MNIKSSRHTRPTIQRRPSPSISEKSPEDSKSPDESWSVPRIITKPRAILSGSIKILRATEGFGLMDNPISTSVQNTVSTLGVAFYGANVGAELLDGDYKGALKDVGNGWVSFTAGAKILGLPPTQAGGMYATGGILNLALAVDEIKNGDKVTGALRLGNATGLLLSATNLLVGGSAGAVIGPLSQAVLGTVGLTAIVRDLMENGGFYNRPDMFS